MQTLVRGIRAAVIVVFLVGCHSDPPVRAVLPTADASLRPTALASIDLVGQQPPGVYAADAYVVSIGPAGLVLTTQPPVAGQAVAATQAVDSGGWNLEAFQPSSRYRFTVRVDSKGGAPPKASLLGAAPL